MQKVIDEVDHRPQSISVEFRVHASFASGRRAVRITGMCLFRLRFKMGVKGLLNLLKLIQERIHVRNFSHVHGSISDTGRDTSMQNTEFLKYF